jgi:hypothetical protein
VRNGKERRHRVIQESVFWFFSRSRGHRVILKPVAISRSQRTSRYTKTCMCDSLDPSGHRVILKPVGDLAIPGHLCRNPCLILIGGHRVLKPVVRFSLIQRTLRVFSFIEVHAIALYATYAPLRVRPHRTSPSRAWFTCPPHPPVLTAQRPFNGTMVSAYQSEELETSEIRARAW